MYFAPIFQEAGRSLKDLIGDESVSFYVSPFIRSQQTYEAIRKSFSDNQVCIPYGCGYHSLVVLPGSLCARGPTHKGTGMGQLSSPSGDASSDGREAKDRIVLLSLSHRRKVGGMHNKIILLKKYLD